MDISALVEVFLARHSNLPHELQHALRQPHINLPAFAGASLDLRWTTSCFTHLEAIFPDVCARWSRSNHFVASLASFGRVISFAPHLAEYAQAFLQRHAQSMQSLWTSIAEDDLVEIVLAIFRLLVANRDIFKQYIDLAVLYDGLQQESRPVRYLCIRILSLHLQAADATTEELIRKYLGTEAVYGPWEGKTIDYTFLSLWEEKRAQDVESEKMIVASLVEETKAPNNQVSIREQDLSPLTVAIFGNLMPRLGADSTSRNKLNLVHTSTTVENVRRFTSALIQEPPILLTGLAGSGKSSIVTYCAQHLNKHESMVTLHLNEQSDAKMLVGMYTSGTTPGTFVWQAGVLTTAVREGRWLLIEDLDRAPNEIISVLLPLIERRELVIPSRGENIKAATGFKIIATIRTTRDLSGNESLPKRNMIGNRFWNRVSVDMLGQHELKEVILGRFKALQPHAEQITAVYAALQDLVRNSRFATLVKAGSARPLTPRDLFKWCQRLDRHFTRHAAFSDAQLDEMFLEAVDCFAGHLAQGEVFDVLAATIAEHLHIDAARRDHLVQSRAIKLASGAKGFSIGRITLRQSSKTRGPRRQQSFAHSPHSLRLLEKLAVAVDSKEPLLLVGETGIGKTTCIQHLASTMNQKLVSFNLSQQSESGDLLGGFKPVNIRGLIMPFREEFDELFNHPLSPFAKRKEDNQHFVDLLGKALAKGQWKKICLMWKSAAAEVQKNLGKVKEPKSPRASEEHHPSKRRRTEDAPATGGEGSHAFYQARWNKFAADIKDLEGHLASKSTAFAFKFVEGTLVKAVRNGHWVLLDEINLATPDTLEALVDLLGTSFGEAPSLLLTESGNIERVTAHPDFRVFAAMNPATDIGKKDLPPGIRSRFTELYIDSPDRDVKSLQHIVSSYLPDELGPRLVADVTNLYVDIQKLAEANMLVDGAGQKPHFSLRTLTRTLVYARDVAAPVGGKDGVYRRALYEGFHMSFLTLLDSASEAVVAPKITQHLFAKHPNAKAELSKSLPKPADGRTYVQEGHYWLHKGGFEPQAQPHYIITPFVRRNLNNLIRAISTKKLPILIQGPTSSGKTSMVEYLAKKSGNKFVRINNHEHTDLQEYLGTYISGADGQLRFQEGILVEALRKGYWIVLDELNLAPTDVLEALNRLLDDNRELLIPETQETVTPHQDFMLFATQNPAGLYGGRKHLSRAFRNRFLELHFDDIPVTELCEILQQRTEIPPSWAQRIVDTYKELSSLRQENRMFEQKSFATLRDLFRWAMRVAEDKQQLAVNGHMLLAERVRKAEEREKVRAVIEQVMSRNGPNVKIDEAELYDAASSPDIAAYQRNVPSSSGVVWTKSMRRLYVLVANAIRNNEPVLLVGETGCGKTTVCQMLAEAMGKELFVVNAHQNTETGDLIGSQRPVRNRSAVEARLASLLKGVIPIASQETTLEELWAAFKALPPESKTTLPAEVLEEIDSLRTKSQALFEWSDGSLVHAMKTGQLFLLDEISLADDSVLERLNSVLEPSRTLLLAEKGATDDASVTATEGFQFLATMNPGGDYGKRELSPALRNRFTEIWVPSLYDLDDILNIVHAKLAPTASAYATAMVEFSSWFKQRYNSSAASAISIRDTLAWIEFVNKFCAAGPILSVLHGAAMVYIDTLGANPAAMLSISMAAIDEERRRCVDKLGRLLQQDLITTYFTVPDMLVNNEQLSLGGFYLPRLIGAAHDAGFTFNAATTRVNAMRVFRALQLSKPLLIEGNPGVGKTTLVTAIAKAVGKELVRINLSEQTDLMDLFGSDVPVEGGSVGTFAWRDAPFLSAMKNGDWVLLDEMNLASQSVLEGLNACLDHRAEAYIAELDQTFHRHQDFRLFAAQNPHHQGGGRKGLPASFVNRFTVVYADVFKQDDLNLICKQVFPAVNDAQIASLTTFVHKLETDVVQRHRFGALGNPWEFNLRDTIRWLQLQTKTDSLLAAGQAYDFCDVIFRQRFRSVADREQIDKLLARVFGTIVDHRSFYHNLSVEAYQVGLGLHRRADVTAFASTSLSPLPPHQLPTLEALMICVELNWPVLLTGNSGSGKTSMLNYLASVAGRRLLTFSMNADIDAMDLVGGYEQADPSRKRADLATKVADKLRELVLMATKQEPAAAARLLANIPASIWSDLPTKDDVTGLLRSLEEAHAPIFDSVTSCLRDLRELPDQIEKAQFEWVDGLLVTALQRGDWLVLDNANLCSSSVLDRLNSLLEPNGYLSINEHPTEDGEPRLVKPHPDFRIFFTVDPRNGELSRAMRNRSIELYIIQDSAILPQVVAPMLGLEASMSRYRTLLRLDDGKAMEYAVDHLSFEDVSIYGRFVDQVQQGLITDPGLQQHASEALRLVSKLDQTWVSQAMISNATPLDVLKNGARQVSPLALIVQGWYADVMLRVYSQFILSATRSLFATIASPLSSLPLLCPLV
jgi:midasin